jgi:hypothetical protein
VSSVVAILAAFGLRLHNGNMSTRTSDDYSSEARPTEEVKDNSDRNIYVYSKKMKTLINKSTQKPFKNNQKADAYVVCYKDMKAQVVQLDGDHVILTRESLNEGKGKELLRQLDRTHTERITQASFYNLANLTPNKNVRVPLSAVSAS